MRNALISKVSPIVVNVAIGVVGVRSQDGHHRTRLKVAKLTPQACRYQNPLGRARKAQFAAPLPIVHHHGERPAHGKHGLNTLAMGMPAARLPRGHIENPKGAGDGEGHMLAPLGKRQGPTLVSDMGQAQQATPLRELRSIHGLRNLFSHKVTKKLGIRLFN